ncbi:hypothetical protein I3843_03G067100 [Carya illinoinensis]|nr:hypothetical protein I3843_03G067100 [Carya illinoinensis]KAG7986151.1 hypothetical protein I3843_03G067100 [Carya illinoinensis]
MASNKFATMLHRNTNKIIVTLVYAILEWVLIILLLLNSLFTYLITKFSNFFGLKPPCLWCSRVDHILEPGRNTNSYRDLICDTHAAEISKLSYCSTHQKLAEPQNMCEDCLASRPSYDGSFLGSTQRIAFVSRLSENHGENGTNIFMCSCCNKNLSCKLCPPSWPSWGALNHNQKDDLVIEEVDDDSNEGEYKELSRSYSSPSHREKDNEIHKKNWEENQCDEGIADEHQIHSDFGGSSFVEVVQEDGSMILKDSTEQDSDDTSFVHRACDNSTIQCFPEQDNSCEVISMHCKNYFACELNRLIPVELIDSSTTANLGSCNWREEDLRKHDRQNRASDSEARIETQFNVTTEAAFLTINECPNRATKEELESFEMAEFDTDNYFTEEVVERKQDTVSEACRQVDTTEEPQTLSLAEEVAGKEPDNPPGACGAEINSINLLSDQSSAKTAIVTEKSDHEAETQAEEPVSSLTCQPVDQASTNDDVAEVSTTPDAFMAQDDLGPSPMEKTTQHEKIILVENAQEGTNNHGSFPSEPNEAEDEKCPDTPNSVDSLHYSQKKLLLFEKRESGAEESLDGSVISEMEGGDAVTTIDRLKAALKAERRNLSALYAELEEERSASAIAANQTMAMITRLQEEKAAMQMEALQYQRMMEEQAEYDQEALQLLNELMIKREKEKQELEKELELHRKKVLDYEAKEKIRVTRRIKHGSLRSRNSSASCSNADESDELSIDLNLEARDEDSSYSSHQATSQNNSPDNAVLNLEEMALDCVKHMSALDESLVEFEEERLSILDQLKALEEKLITLGDDEGYFEDGKSIERSSTYGAKEFDDHVLTSPEENGVPGKHSSLYVVKEVDKHDFTSPEEDGISFGFSKDKFYPERKTMDSMAKSLLPLLDATNNKNEEGLLYEAKGESEYVEMQNSFESHFELDVKKLAIEDEVDHVYERLQALEADREFLKHCMSSIKKGDKGVDLLQEILQHLRDLRAVEIRVKNMNDDTLG